MSNNRNTSTRATQPIGAIVLRNADASDALALAHLAELDSGRVPRHPVLLAEVDGELRAAVSLSDGTAIADPFRPTAGLVDVVRAHVGEPTSWRNRLQARLSGAGTSRPPQPSAPSIPGIPVMPSGTL